MRYGQTKHLHPDSFSRVRAVALLVTEVDTGRQLETKEVILAMNIEKGYTLRGIQQR
jgi:hypothetical protein